MPTNLNALIRYKRIDQELNNPYVKTSIRSLQEACSNQLAEHRGIYKLVSERTIREDIRIMRSSALGFNAPITVNDGFYFYEDTEYSIFNTKMEQKELLKEVLYILIDEKDKINNPKLEGVMKSLSKITGIPIEKTAPDKTEKKISLPKITRDKIGVNYSIAQKSRKPAKFSGYDDVYSFSIKSEASPSFSFDWKLVLNLV